MSVGALVQEPFGTAGSMRLISAVVDGRKRRLFSGAGGETLVAQAICLSDVP